MYDWRYPMFLIVAASLISCGLCVSVPTSTLNLHLNSSSSESGNHNGNPQVYSLKLSPQTQPQNSKYRQQRELFERQFPQQPVGHCFQIWEESSSAMPETDVNSICGQENWFLLDATRGRNISTSVFYASALSSPESANFLSYYPQHRFTNQEINSPKRILQQTFSLPSKESTCFQRWMTLLHRQLSNTRLGDLMIPGTHNSASFSVSPNGILVEKLWVSRLALSLGFHDYFSSWARNHDGTILAQLNAGYRCFDLRVAVLPNGGFYWWHGISGEAIDADLKDIAEFSRNNTGEIIILLISHLNAPGNGELTKLPMPYQSKLQLGRHLLSILGSSLVPTSNISLNPTLSSVLATGRNVIAIIREDLDLVNAFPEYFWSGANNQTTVEFFERKTNPRTMFRHRSSIMQNYKEHFPDRMAITPAFVTHSVPNILGGILRSSRVTWILSAILFITFYALSKTWLPHRPLNTVYYCWPEHYNIFCMKRRGANKPVTFVRFSFIYVTVISLSVSLAHLQQKTILHFLGFEGKATNLLEMARIANLCGDDPSRPVRDIMYQSINSMIRHWSNREQEYRLNIVLVDDFSSSQVVQTAIRDNIRRTDRKQRHHLQSQRTGSFNKENENKKWNSYKRKRLKG